MISPPDFDNFYSTVLEDLIGNLESQRVKVKTLRTWLLLPTLLGVSFFILNQYTPGQQSGVFILGAVICLIAAVVLFFIFRDKKQLYISAFKQTIITPLINYIDPGFKYDFSSCISESDYKKSGLFLRIPDSFEGDDFVEGTRGKTYFCFSEIYTQYKVSTGKSTSWVKIFKGLFFIADFNKNFSGRTYVWSENAPQLNFFNKHFLSFASDLEKVLLESSEFEKRFIVYSNDQVEARYILTPTMMERMVRIQDMFGRNTVFSFVDTNVYVAIPMDHPLFEPAISKSPGRVEVAEYYYTIKMVLDLIDELDLNLRIWNKE
jgi:hypothetical protein